MELVANLPVELWEAVWRHLDFRSRMALMHAVAGLWRRAPLWRELAALAPLPRSFGSFGRFFKHMGIRRRLVRWGAFCAARCRGCGAVGLPSRTYPLGFKLCGACQYRHTVPVGANAGPYCWLPTRRSRIEGGGGPIPPWG